MALRFVGKGGSEQSSCPSVSVDETDGSFVFVGYPETTPALSPRSRPMAISN